MEVPDNGWGLEGKVALVTGGGAAGDGIGNGRAAAILLARAGARVVVADRDLKLARRTVEMIESGGGQAIAVEVDVTRASDCAALVKTAVERFGRLDVLDNNVGIGSRGSVVDLAEEEWRRVMQVNVETMFLVAKHVIPAMRRAGGGAIVNVSSGTGRQPQSFNVDYSGAKAAMMNLTKALSEEFGPRGVRVNGVAPGPVMTPWWTDEGGAGDRIAAMAGLDRDTVLSTGAAEMMNLTTGRLAEPQEIADAVVFLASPRSASTTGAEFAVDSGLIKAL
jgi:NAD(P)-dependent dehydrogenase (short-subunit alcohol dehydrogenase family)